MAAHVQVASWQLDDGKEKPFATIYANRYVPEHVGCIFDIYIPEENKIDKVKVPRVFSTKEAAVEYCESRGWSHQYLAW